MLFFGSWVQEPLFRTPLFADRMAEANPKAVAKPKPKPHPKWSYGYEDSKVERIIRDRFSERAAHSAIWVDGKSLRDRIKEDLRSREDGTGPPTKMGKHYYTKLEELYRA